jgi:outer membrane protein OmpA-like peptidoglycan-associated protein/tetratricopeptide (TPR) repeat protein
MMFYSLKKGIIAIVLSCTVYAAFSQKSTIRKADLCCKEQLYPRAYQFYLKAYSKDTTDMNVLRRLAETAYRVGKNEEALRYFKKLVSRRAATRADYLLFAKALKTDGNYEQSTFWLMQYNKQGGDDPSGEALELQLMDILALLSDSLDYIVKPLSINTPESEMGAFVYGNKLIFCSAGLQNTKSRKSYLDDLPFLKRYETSLLGKGEVARPDEFQPQLASRHHDGPLSIADSVGRMFVSMNAKGRNKRKVKPGGFVNLEIKQAELRDGKWEYTTDFPYNSKRYSLAHPAVNPSGTSLVFASNMVGGYGQTDLYISHLVNGRWTLPRNLGEDVNTPGRESFPYWANDSTVYFASDGHEGLGGLDLFKTTLSKDGHYTQVRNLGYPVNSPADDFSLTLYGDDEHGFFASNRKGGKGSDDLYYFEKTNVGIPFRFVVSDKASGKPLGMAQLNVLNMSGDTVAIGSTDESGFLSLDLVPGETYSVHASKPNYFESRMAITPVKKRGELAREIKANLYFNPNAGSDGDHPLYLDLEDGEPIQVLEVFSIHYKLDTWMIGKSEFETLESVLNFVDANPGTEIRIESHADCRGSREYNNRLSEMRAMIVNNYFVSRYISPEKIRYQGFGESRLLNICSDDVKCDENEHAVNRRSIIKVIRKGPYFNMKVRKDAFYY